MKKIKSFVFVNRFNILYGSAFILAGCVVAAIMTAVSNFINYVFLGL